MQHFNQLIQSKTKNSEHQKHQGNVRLMKCFSPQSTKRILPHVLPLPYLESLNNPKSEIIVKCNDFAD